jgi:hypothetical protein
MLCSETPILTCKFYVSFPAPNEKWVRSAVKKTPSNVLCTYFIVHALTGI